MEGDRDYTDEIKAIQLYAQNVVFWAEMIIDATENEDSHLNADYVMDQMFNCIDQMAAFKDEINED